MALSSNNYFGSFLGNVGKILGYFIFQHLVMMVPYFFNDPLKSIFLYEKLFRKNKINKKRPESANFSK